MDYDSLYHWDYQGFGHGLGFLNIAPEKIAANIDPNLLANITIKCGKLYWDYTQEIDLQAKLNTKVALVIEDLESISYSITGVDARNSLMFPLYYPALNNIIRELANSLKNCPA